MEKNREHSLYPYLNERLQKTLNFSLHQSVNDVYAHEMFESTPMKLSNLAEIRFSRKPSLDKSFFESGLNPLMMVEKDYQAIGVIAEQSAYLSGQQENCYYTSDLRMKSGTPLKIFKEFLAIYSETIQQIKKSCFTVILKDNLRAMKVLTGRLKGLKYWPIYEYESKSILVLPTIKLLSKNKKLSVSLSNDKKKLEIYISKHYKKNYFSHPVDLNNDNYIFTENGEIKGTFSIGEPNNRKMQVKSLSKRVSTLLALATFFTGHRYKETIPWKYVTNFMVDDELINNKLLSTLLKFLYSKKIIKSGDLLLFCHDVGQYQNFSYLGPVISTNGFLFEINNGESEIPPNQQCSINPMSL